MKKVVIRVVEVWKDSERRNRLFAVKHMTCLYVMLVEGKKHWSAARTDVMFVPESLALLRSWCKGDEGAKSLHGGRRHCLHFSSSSGLSLPLPTPTGIRPPTMRVA